MPHQCIRCSKMYEDAAKELLEGCSCGSKFFFFMRKRDIETVQQMTVKLSSEEKIQLEKDALELVGEEEPERPVILELESIRMLKPGKFEIDLIDLFRGRPLVYKVGEGKYVIDIASTFKSKELDPD